MAEQWKSVVGYEGMYEVSDLGRVRSLSYRRTGNVKLMAGSIGRNGYHQVPLYRGAERTPKYVHRLVLEAFVGPCPEGMEACHGNGIRADNRLENLRWDALAKNQHDRVRHGTHSRGERSPTAKLSAGAVERIHDLKRTGCKQAAIARWLSVSPMTVSLILRRKRWAHLAAA